MLVKIGFDLVYCPFKVYETFRMDDEGHIHHRGGLHLFFIVFFMILISAFKI